MNRAQRALLEQTTNTRRWALALVCSAAAASGLASNGETAAARAATALATDPPPAAKTPRQLISETVDQAFSILRDPELKKDRQERLRRLRAAVDAVFDWEKMAQSSLGHHWRKLDASQRAAFVDIFKELLAQKYMDDIDRFQGTERVVVKGEKSTGGSVLVETVLITSSREEVPIDYLLYAGSGGHKVEDFSVERVSLVNHYRQTFSRFLVSRSFDELLEQLRRKLGR